MDWKPGRLDELNSPNDVRAQAIRGRGRCDQERLGCAGASKGYLGFGDERRNSQPADRPGKIHDARGLSFPGRTNGAPMRSADWQGELKTGPATVKVEQVMGFEISLGIRDNTRIGRFSNMQQVEYPLAFRVKNTGKRTIGQENEPGLFS